MVSAGLVIAAGAALVLLVGGLGTVGEFTGFLKRKLNAEQLAEEKAAAKTRDEKGAIGNTVDFIFGEGTTQANRTKTAQEQLKQNIISTEANIEKQAKQAGFSSLADFEKATDSCSLVVGGSKTMCDVGLIGSSDSIVPKGGQSNLGTQTVKTFGKRTVKA